MASSSTSFMAAVFSKFYRLISPSGIVPVLGILLEQSTSTEYAYLCHPAVQHISKLRREGVV